MSYYDDASFVFLPSGGAGKAGGNTYGKVFTLKPEEEVTGSELVTNGDFDSLTIADLGEANITDGWRHLNSHAAASVVIENGVAKIKNVAGTDSRLYATNGTNDTGILSNNKNYKVVYTVVENQGVTSFKYYVNGGFQDAPSAVGTHAIILEHKAVNNLFLFQNATANSEIHLDNISIKELGQKPYDFDVSRDSNITATRVNNTGVIEKGRENLFTYSNQFDTTWGVGGSPTLTGSQAGYDGSTNAWKLVTSSDESIFQTIAPSGVNTFSVFVKGDGSTGVRLWLEGPGNDADCFFNLSSGSIVHESPALLDAQIVDAGSNWHRVSITFFDADTGSGVNQNVTKCRIYTTNNATSNAAGTIFIQDAQLEKGLVATPYIESGTITGKAGILQNEPRFDYLHRVKGKSSCGGLMMEIASSNMFKMSECFEHEWTASDVDVDTNVSAVKSPEGVYNTTLIKLQDTVSEEKYIIEGGLSVTDGKMYALSFFAKKKDFDYITCRFTAHNSAFDAGSAWFNLNTGQIATKATEIMYTYMDDYGDGWYRCVAVAECKSTDTNAQVRIQLANADGAALAFSGTAGHGTYIYGAQLEELPYATSYMPMHGTSAGRSADNLPTLDISDFNIDKHFSIYWEGFVLKQDIPQAASDSLGAAHLKPIQRIYTTFDTTEFGGDRILLYNTYLGDGAFNFTAQHRVDSASVQKTKSNLTRDEKVKSLIVVDGSSFKFFVNGVQIGTALSVPDHKSLCKKLDFSDVIADQGNVHEQLLIFPFALSDAEGVDITT